MHIFDITYTDLYAGEPNYSWVQRSTVALPELTHYGFDGLFGYTAAATKQRRELLRAAKKLFGLTGVRGVVTDYGHTVEFRPYKRGTVLICGFREQQPDVKRC